jgi:methionyl-tRNA synthetase
VRTGLNLVALFARVSAPFIPFASETVALALGEPYPAPWPGPDLAAELSRVPAGRRVAAPPLLFRKIEEAEVAAWTERFGGAQP